MTSMDTPLLHPLCNPLHRCNLHSWPVQDAPSSVLPFLGGKCRIYRMNQVLGHLMSFLSIPLLLSLSPSCSLASLLLLLVLVGSFYLFDKENVMGCSSCPSLDGVLVRHGWSLRRASRACCFFGQFTSRCKASCTS
jgi:hypothetical protein